MRDAGRDENRVAGLYFARRLIFHFEREAAFDQIAAFCARVAMRGDIGVGGELCDPEHRFIIRPRDVGFLQNGPLNRLRLTRLLCRNGCVSDDGHQQGRRDAKRRSFDHLAPPSCSLDVCNLRMLSLNRSVNATS
jgi:hypothetical protein